MADLLSLIHTPNRGSSQSKDAYGSNMFTTAPKQTGKLTLIEISHLQMESGISHPILTNLLQPIPYITPCWITSLRDFLYIHNISLEFADGCTASQDNTIDSLWMYWQTRTIQPLNCGISTQYDYTSKLPPLLRLPQPPASQ